MLDLVGRRVDLTGAWLFSNGHDRRRLVGGRAFLIAGATGYVAPDDDPHGADAGLFVLLLFHRLLRRGDSLASALRLVQGCDREFGVFRLWSKENSEHGAP